RTINSWPEIHTRRRTLYSTTYNNGSPTTPAATSPKILPARRPTMPPAAAANSSTPTSPARLLRRRALVLSPASATSSGADDRPAPAAGCCSSIYTPGDSQRTGTNLSSPLNRILTGRAHRMPPKAPNATDAEGQVATNQQRREAAKRKLDRQLTRQAERAKRRKIVGTGVTIGAVLVAAGLVVFIVTRGDPSTAGQASEQKTSSTAKSSANKTTSGPCQYESSPRGSAGKDVGLPSDPKQTPDSGRVDAALHTNLGTLDITLDRSKAPCTVQSMVHLIESGFYEDSPCHRLTTREKLNVLQCGDPTGTGKGGPGYTIPDEPP